MAPSFHVQGTGQGTVAVQPQQPQHRFDANTGQPLQAAPATFIQPQTQPQARFDPVTGQPLQAPQAPQARFDSMTGQPITAVAPGPAQVAAFGFQPPLVDQRFAPLPANAAQNNLQPHLYPIGTPAQADVRGLMPINPMHVDPVYASQFPGVSYEAAQRAMGPGGGAGLPPVGTVTDGQMRHAQQPVQGVPTDPLAMRNEFLNVFGHTAEGYRAAETIAQMFEAKIRSLGLDRVDRQFLAFPETHAEHERSDLANEVFSRSGIAPTPKAQAMDAWFRFVLFGRQPDTRTEMGQVVHRALSEGTDSEGGYIVPPGFIAEIIADAPALSALYQFARRIPVGTMAGEIPNVAANAGVAWGAEATAIGEADPAFGNATWAIKRLNALVKLSREVANDSNPSIVDFVVTLFREKIVEERDRVVAVGNGITEPQGLAGAAGLIDQPDFTVVNYANLVDMHEAVDHRYLGRPDFRWWFNQTNKATIMKLVDLDGRPLIQLDPTAGFTSRLFNTPISVDNNFPTSTMGIGALRYYLVFDRETLGTERSTEAGTAFATHQLWVKFWERWDGKPVFPPTRPMARTTSIV